MHDRFRPLREATLDAVLRGPGRTAAELRQALSRGEAPPDLAALVDRIRHTPWAVTDADWAPLRARFDEEEQFELVVAAVVGAADDRFRAAIAALEGA